MSPVTRLPPVPKKVHVEADIPERPLDEFNHSVAALIAGERPQMDALAREAGEVVTRATGACSGLRRRSRPSRATHARRLVKFRAGVCNGEDYPFELGERPALETALANACLECLNYDRLGQREAGKHLKNGDREPRRWLERDDLLRRDP